MRLTFLGTDPNFIENAFFGPEGLDGDIVSATATQIEVFNPSTGMTTIVTGTGFAVNAEGEVIGGTINSFSMSNGGVVQGTITEVAWSVVAFSNALDEIELGNFAPMAAVLSSGGSIIIDASSAMGSYADYSFPPVFGELGTLITAPITYTDSPFQDRIFGGLGNDTINFGSDGTTTESAVWVANGFEFYNQYHASGGNDTLDFTNVNPSYRIYIDLDYDLEFAPGSGPITATINASTNSGTISTSGFTDTLVGVNNALSWGLGVNGTVGSDVFNATLSSGSWLMFSGDQGTDTFNIALMGGTLRLNYLYGSGPGPSMGIVADIGAGTITDGWGAVDTLNITDNNGVLEIRATTNNDSILGSAGNERFILEAGTDTVDGAGGFDTVRYDRSGVTAVNVDLATQTATGSWNGTGFTHTLISIEGVRGSRDGNDTISGSGAAETFYGRGGNDSLSGLAGDDMLDGEDGNDTLDGGDGNDNLLGGNGDDLIYGGNNFDTVSAGDGADTVFGGNGRDLIFLNQGDDLFNDNAQGGELGRDTVYAGLGNDTVEGGNGDDVFYGEDGDDVINGRLGDDTIYGGNNFDTISAGEGADRVWGGNGRDLVFLNQGNDIYYDNGQGGELGSDTVFAGLGDDTIEGGNGADEFHGEDGNDLIHARLGDDTVYGGNNYDTIFAGDGNDVVFGGNGRDLIFLNQGDDVYNDNGQGGVNGQDTVYAGFGNDTIQGGNGDDQFYGEWGNDLIFARLGNDTVGGGDGDDTINGGGGSDTLTGSVGSDTFVFTAGDETTGTDLVTDFTFADDTVRFEGVSPSDVTLSYDSGLNEATIFVSGTAAVVLDGVDSLATFSVDDIVFFL